MNPHPATDVHGSRFLALLRGINVGRGRRLAMADLRAVLQGLGYGEVRTLLNSGNAVFVADSADTFEHARRIGEALMDTLSLPVPVIVKSAPELAAIVAENPFAAEVENPSRLLVAFPQFADALEDLRGLGSLLGPGERFRIGPLAAYLHCPGGLLESRVGEALLGPRGRRLTTRNWATTLKLAGLCGNAA